VRETLVAIRSREGKPITAAIVTIELRQEGNSWLAECLEVGTATYGPTLEQARKEIVEAMTLQLNQVEELGFIDEFMRDHGVQQVPIEPPREGSGWNVPAALPA